MRACNELIDNSETPNGPAASRTVPQIAGEMRVNGLTSQSSLNDAQMFSSNQSDSPTRFLWIGNLTANATRPVLCRIFERFGVLEDLIAFPSRMYAFVTYQSAENAIKAVQTIQGIVIKEITGEKGMIIKYRPEKRAMSYGDTSSKNSSSGKASSAGEYEVEPSPRIWIGNIAPTATAANLQAVLGRFGPLLDAAVFPARIGPLGYAFVKFERIEDAVSAYNTLNNAVVPALSGTKQVKMRYKPISEGLPARDTTLDALHGSIPSRHIWIGNVTQKPQEEILIQIFSRFGSIESARVFSAKSYAFVNFFDVGSAVEAMTTLDGVSVPALTGLKPLVMRYQHDTHTGQTNSSRVALNSKMLDIVAKSRVVPDSQALLSSLSMPSPVSLQSQLPGGGGVMMPFPSNHLNAGQNLAPSTLGSTSSSGFQNNVREASAQLSSVLQNLTALKGNLHQNFVGNVSRFPNQLQNDSYSNFPASDHTSGSSQAAMWESGLQPANPALDVYNPTDVQQQMHNDGSQHFPLGSNLQWHGQF